MQYETKCPCRAREHIRLNNGCEKTDCDKCCPLAKKEAEEKTDHEAD